MSKAISHTLIYGLCLAVTKGLSLLMLPFITGHLSVEEYGRLEVISSIAILGSVIVGFGLEDALYRFAGSETNAAERLKKSSNIFIIAWLLSAIFLAVVIPVAFLVADALPQAISFHELLVTLVILAFEGVIAVPLGWLRMRDRAVLFCIVALIRVVIQVGLTIAFLLLDYGVIGVLLAGLCAAACQAFILSYLHFSDTGFFFKRKLSLSVGTYSVPLVLSGLVGFCMSGLDRWVLATFSSLEALALYGVAAKLSLAVVLLIQPFQMWWNPRRFTVMTHANGEKEFVSIVSLGVFICILLSVLVVNWAPVAIRLFLSEEYIHAIPFIVLIVIGFALKEGVELINFGCLKGQTTQAQFYINLLSGALAVALMIPLAKYYDLNGVLCALIVAQLCRLIAFYLVGQVQYTIAYPIGRWLKLVALALVCLFLVSQAELMLDGSILANILTSFGASLCLTLYAYQLGMLDKVVSGLPLNKFAYVIRSKWA